MDLLDVGSYLTVDLSGQPILILRSKDGEVRAFFNVCQHRGDILVSGQGRLKTRIVCPYHAWCYGLDGSLLTARAGFSGFETRGGEPYLTWTLWPNLCLLSLPGSP